MTNKEKLDLAIKNLEMEYPKFEKGNKSAAARTRKALLEIHKLSKEIRKEITETVNKEK